MGNWKVALKQLIVFMEIRNSPKTRIHSILVIYKRLKNAKIYRDGDFECRKSKSLKCNHKYSEEQLM